MFVRLTAVHPPHNEYSGGRPPPYTVVINIDNIVSIMEYGDGTVGISLLQLSNGEDFYIQGDLERVCGLIYDASRT